MLSRQNFSNEGEEALNLQINQELTASYVYMAMSAYFQRDGIALHGFAKFFKHSSEEEREHAQKLIDYVTRRGGVVKFYPLTQPEVNKALLTF